MLSYVPAHMYTKAGVELLICAHCPKIKCIEYVLSSLFVETKCSNSLCLDFTIAALLIDIVSN